MSLGWTHFHPLRRKLQIRRWQGQQPYPQDSASAVVPRRLVKVMPQRMRCMLLPNSSLHLQRMLPRFFGRNRKNVRGKRSKLKTEFEQRERS